MVQGKKVMAFIAASGTGTRMKLSIPKQFITIDDIPICFYPLRQLQDNERIDEIAIAIPEGWYQYVKTFSDYLEITKLKYIVIGGDTMFKSIKNMVSEVNKDNESYIMCLNDGDRLIFDDVFNESLDNYERNGNTIPYFNPYEIAFYQDSGKTTEIDRNKVLITCTPHIYSSEAVNEAIEYANEKGMDNGYLHQLVVQLGYEISFIKCSRHNLKVTLPDDLEVIKALIHERKANGTPR